MYVKALIIIYWNHKNSVIKYNKTEKMTSEKIKNTKIYNKKLKNKNSVLKYFKFVTNTRMSTAT